MIEIIKDLLNTIDELQLDTNKDSRDIFCRYNNCNYILIKKDDTWCFINTFNGTLGYYYSKEKAVIAVLSNLEYYVTCEDVKVTLKNYKLFI